MFTKKIETRFRDMPLVSFREEAMSDPFSVIEILRKVGYIEHSKIKPFNKGFLSVFIFFG